MSFIRALILSAPMFITAALHSEQSSAATLALQYQTPYSPDTGSYMAITLNFSDPNATSNAQLLQYNSLSASHNINGSCCAYALPALKSVDISYGTTTSNLAELKLDVVDAVFTNIDLFQGNPRPDNYITADAFLMTLAAVGNADPNLMYTLDGFGTGAGSIHDNSLKLTLSQGSTQIAQYTAYHVYGVYYFVEPVPVPPAMPLFGSGLILLTTLRKKFNRATRS